MTATQWSVGPWEAEEALSPQHLTVVLRAACRRDLSHRQAALRPADLLGPDPDPDPTAGAKPCWAVMTKRPLHFFVPQGCRCRCHATVAVAGPDRSGEYSAPSAARGTPPAPTRSCRRARGRGADCRWPPIPDASAGLCSPGSSLALEMQSIFCLRPASPKRSPRLQPLRPRSILPRCHFSVSGGGASDPPSEAAIPTSSSKRFQA